MADAEILENENRALRVEVIELRARCRTVEGLIESVRLQIDALDDHTGALENLFVALCRLHASLDPADTRRMIEEILYELVGARRFSVIVHGEHGSVTVASGDEHPAGQAEGAIASVPLTLGSRVVGEVLIHELLPQKDGTLTALDRRLLKLIGDQAALALVSIATLGTDTRRMAAWEDLVAKLSNPTP